MKIINFHIINLISLFFYYYYATFKNPHYDLLSDLIILKNYSR